MSTHIALVAQTYPTETATPTPDPAFSGLDGLDPGIGFLMLVLVLLVIGVGLMIHAHDEPAWRWAVGPACLVLAVVVTVLAAEAIGTALITLLFGGVFVAVVMVAFTLISKH